MISALPHDLLKPTAGSCLRVMILCLLLGTSSTLNAQFDEFKAEPVDSRHLAPHTLKPHVVYEVDWKMSADTWVIGIQAYSTGELEEAMFSMNVSYDPENPRIRYLQAKMLFLSNPEIPAETLDVRILISDPGTVWGDEDEEEQISGYLFIMEKSFQLRIKREYGYGDLLREIALDSYHYETYRIARGFVSALAARNWIRDRGFPSYRIRETTLEY